MRNGDLLQWHGGDLISKIIAWKTGSPVTHSGMVFRLPRPTGQGDRVFTLEAAAFGLYPTYLRRHLSWYLPHGKVFWHKMRPEIEDLGPQAADLLQAYVGLHYDFKDLMRQAWRRVKLDTKKLFCSEAVFLAWYELARMGAKKLEHLLDIEYAPYPSEMTSERLALYEPEGIRILP